MFITFSQNNSGGYFIQNEDVDEYVIIEGNSLNEIQNRANKIFENYRKHCQCCGERWSSDITCDDLDDEPMIYESSVYDFNEPFSESAKAIIYYSNGHKEIIDVGLKKKEKYKDKYGFKLIRYADNNSWGFDYGEIELKLPEKVNVEVIKTLTQATKNGSPVMVFDVFEGIKLSYKNGFSDIIKSNLNSKQAYEKAMDFIKKVDNEVNV